MANLASSPFPPRLQDAAAEGRLAGVFPRRDQLRQLQEGLIGKKDTLLAAAVQDGKGSGGSGITPSEALAELYLTLTAVKQFHDGLAPGGPDGQIAAEYRIASGRDAADAQAAVGIVVVVPQRHTLLYSVVVPLAAAIAAGNCVVVVLENTLQVLPSLLSSILADSLDRDICEVVSTRPAIDARTTNCVEVVQTGEEGEAQTAQAVRTLVSPARALVVAIVDRTADLEQAARLLVDARLAFGGRSPYAPDLVLVNEYAKQGFLRAAVQRWIGYTTAAGQAADSESGRGGAADHRGVRTVASGSDSRIADVVERSALSQLGKTARKTLHVHAIRSLDDAIELVADLASETPLAVYAFGDLPSCKYLLQFVPAQAGFANTIPPELLIGPAAPQSHALSLPARYLPSLFALPRPKFAETSALSRELAEILDSRPAAVEAKLLRKVEVEARAPVRLITGYFERAALIGLITRVAALGVLAYFGVQKGIRGK